MQIYLVLALIFALFVATFAVQNTTPVAITFILWRVQEISLVLVILGSAAFGAFCVFLLGMVKQVSLTFKIRELESKIKQFQAEYEKIERKLEVQETGEIIEDVGTKTEI